tara:strand:- start:2664 stop:3104 length:441 start_codon:yes stop_codon:yes gene_type:complete
MLRTNTLKYRANFKNYILRNIDTEQINSDLYPNEYESTKKLMYVMDCFDSEYNHEYNRRRYPNHQDRFEQWLSGLPSCLNLPCYYYDMIGLAKALHEVEELTEKQRDKICNNFFKHVAYMFLQIFRKHMEQEKDSLWTRRFARCNY